MSKKPLIGAKRSSLSTRLETLRYLNEISSSPLRRPAPLQQIAEALIEAGYKSLDAQAKALGIHRATVWTIITRKHKVGRLNTPTIERILANPDTPPSVRAVIQQYAAQRVENPRETLLDG